MSLLDARQPQKVSLYDFILQPRYRLVYGGLPIYDFIKFRAVTILGFGP